jgi:hypothetical protein
VVGLYGLDVRLLEDDLLGFFMFSPAPLPIHVGIAFFYAFHVISLLSLFGMLVFS